MGGRVHSSILPYIPYVPHLEKFWRSLHSLNGGGYAVRQVYHGKTTIIFQETLVLTRLDDIMKDVHGVIFQNNHKINPLIKQDYDCNTKGRGGRGGNHHLPVVPPPGAAADKTPGNLKDRKSTP